MNRTAFAFVLALLAVLLVIAAVLATRPKLHSLVGRWEQTGGAEMMVLFPNGDLEVSEPGGFVFAESYSSVDPDHLMVRFVGGAPRLVQVSVNRREMTWTNDLGLVQHYTYKPGSSLFERLNKAHKKTFGW